MSIRVEIPASMRAITNGKGEVYASGTTIKELISDLDRQYPGMKSKLCDDTGRIQKFIAVFVDGCDIRTLQKDETPLKGSESILIIAAIAGG